MNQEIFDAARTGNIAGIISNFPRNQTVPMSETEWTPLHIACFLGNHYFSLEFLKIYPEYLTLVNPNDCNALHLASSNGHLDTVEMLLKFGHPVNQPAVNRELCIKRDKDGRIPLHHAVINGNIYVTKRLIDACPESILEVTNQKETVFHLAVKNKESPSDELFKILLGAFYSGYMLNLADGDGNTVLHLAVVRKQIQIVRLLVLNEEFKHCLEVNPVNSSGFTPLDLLVIDHMNKIDREIQRIIISVGGIRLQEGQEQRENLKSMASGLIVMSSLTATTASCRLAVYFQGAFWSDNAPYQSSSISTSTSNLLLNTEKEYEKYTKFVFLDGLTLSLSLCLLVLLLFPAKAKYSLQKWAGIRFLAYSITVAFVLLFSALVSNKMKRQLKDLQYLVFLPFIGLFMTLIAIPLRKYSIPKKSR